MARLLLLWCFFLLATTSSRGTDGLAPAQAPNAMAPKTPPTTPPTPTPPATPPTPTPPPPPANPTPGSSSPPPGSKDSSSSELSGGQKAGVVIGVLLGAGLIGFGGLVYKKRRANIRRARFGLGARRAQL